MLRRHSFAHCRLIPVVFTAGERESFNIDRYHVPKRDLIQGLAILLESGNLLVEPRLPEPKPSAASYRTSAGTPSTAPPNTTTW